MSSSESSAASPTSSVVTVRLPSGSKLEVLADPLSTTVLQLKEKIAVLGNIPAAESRLVFAGRIMSDDSSLLSEYGIKDRGDIINLARKASNSLTAPSAASPASSVVPTPATAQASSPFGNMREMMNNPLIQSLLDNPTFMESILQSDPRLRQMSERNPEVARMMRDPQFLRQMSETMRNPALMQEMMRNHDRQLSNIEAIPGGFNYLSSMYHEMEEPGDTAAATRDSEEANRRMAEALGVSQTHASSGPNDQPLPNPWAPTRPATARNATTPASQPVPAAQAPSLGMPFAFPFGAPASSAGATTPGQAAAAGSVDEQQILRQLELLNLVLGGSSRTGPSAPSAPSTTAATTTTPTTTPTFAAPTTTTPAASALPTTPQTTPFPGAWGAPWMMGPGANANADPAALQRQLETLQLLFGGGALGSPYGGGFGGFPVYPNAAGVAAMTPTAGSPGGTAPASTVTSAERHQQLKEQHRPQLDMLKDMGFDDEEKCLKALLASGGNVDAAVGYMLDM
ncbi:uncharacterized protein BJ171DRAFT_532126 [Polychytrium aggregatum]|uniref:uncharacterized protein n=1 Tax=Polychytrium aggregatum TaxID=110093 RepID=UPI0022FEDBB5|nr:uncharacterized protein BJ171DRAFT_532126 [Polychytrium aggregatum]KAI9193208.1 hypothetical protein BJ171DRAFT_532126 [Polychytrium aggregatum]